jgi:hypothetical protein
LRIDILLDLDRLEENVGGFDGEEEVGGDESGDEMQDEEETLSEVSCA